MITKYLKLTLKNNKKKKRKYFLIFSFYDFNKTEH